MFAAYGFLLQLVEMHGSLACTALLEGGIAAKQQALESRHDSSFAASVADDCLNKSIWRNLRGMSACATSGGDVCRSRKHANTP